VLPESQVPVPFQSLPPHCCQTGMALTVAAKTAAEVMKFLMFGDVGVVIVVLKWKFPGYDIFWYDESALYISSRASYRQHRPTHSTEGPSVHGCSVYRLSIEPHGVPNSTVSSNRLILGIWICKVARPNPGKTESRPCRKVTQLVLCGPCTDYLRLNTVSDLAWRASLVQKADLFLVQYLQSIASILLEA
jgi:hypothetical protein